VNGRSKLALKHDTLSSISATFDPVLRLAVGKSRKKADHLVDAADVVLSDGINRPLAGSRIDADPYPHKITNLEPRLGHVRSINSG
jgi:hypothetical protein